MTAPKTVEEIGTMQETVLQSKFDLLTQRGWTLDTLNIAGHELWQKAIDGKTYLVELETALSIELAVDYQSCTCDDEPPSPCPIHPEADR